MQQEYGLMVASFKDHPALKVQKGTKALPAPPALPALRVLPALPELPELLGQQAKASLLQTL
jgi:hypothetical protein